MKKHSAWFEIKIITDDRIGELERITTVFGNLGINVLKTRARFSPLKKRFICHLSFKVEDLDILANAVEELAPKIRESVKWEKKKKNHKHTSP